MSDKPREWTIKNDSEYDFHVIGPDITRFHDVHVIEYTAYTAERERADRLEAEYARAAGKVHNLQAEVERLKNDGAWSKALMVPGLLAERDQALAKAAKCMEEYAEYVRGKPGSWYVTQLQAECDQLKTETERTNRRATELKAKLKSVEINRTLRTYDDIVPQLSAEVERLEKLWEQCTQGCADYRKNNAKLKVERDRYRAALEYYAKFSRNPEAAREALTPERIRGGT